MRRGGGGGGDAAAAMHPASVLFFPGDRSRTRSRRSPGGSPAPPSDFRRTRPRRRALRAPLRREANSGNHSINPYHPNDSANHTKPSDAARRRLSRHAAQRHVHPPRERWWRRGRPSATSASAAAAASAGKETFVRLPRRRDERRRRLVASSARGEESRALGHVRDDEDDARGGGDRGCDEKRSPSEVRDDEPSDEGGVDGSEHPSAREEDDVEPAMGDGEELGEGGEDDGVGAADAEPAKARQKTRAGKEVDAAERRAKRALTAMDAARAGRRPTRSPRTPHRMEPTSAPAKMASEKTLVRVGQAELRARGGEDQRHGEHLHRVRRVGEHAQRRESILEGPTPTRSRARSGRATREGSTRRDERRRRPRRPRPPARRLEASQRAARAGRGAGAVTRRSARGGVRVACTRGLRVSSRKKPTNPAGTTVERATPWRRRCVRTNSPTRTSDGCARRSSRLRGAEPMGVPVGCVVVRDGEAVATGAIAPTS